MLKTTTDPSFQTIQIPQKPFFSGKMPLPPSTNQAYKVVYSKTHMRVGPSIDLTIFKDGAAMMLSQAYHDWSLINAIRESRRKVPLAVKIQAYFATEWKRDLDGIVKFAMDAAFDRIALNDNLVVRIDVEKLVDPMEPRIEIEIRCVVR